MSLGKLSSEELHCILQSQSNTFKEESILQSGFVLDVVGGGQYMLDTERRK